MEKVSPLIDNIFEVGDVVRLRCELLNNKEGALGFCYDSYKIGGRQGASFIFSNGNYDGFSPSEQLQMLEYVRTDEYLSNYEFTNVIMLSRNFEEGYFNSVLT